MADPAHPCRGEDRQQARQDSAIEQQGAQGEDQAEGPALEPANQEEITEQAVDHTRESVAAVRPPEPDGNGRDEDPQPDREVVPFAFEANHPRQRQKQGAVGQQMAPAAVAEGSRQDSQRGPPGNHRQIPLPPEQELIDPLLQPGDSQDDDRDQQGRLELCFQDHGPIRWTSMTARASSGRPRKAFSQLSWQGAIVATPTRRPRPSPLRAWPCPRCRWP